MNNLDLMDSLLLAVKDECFKVWGITENEVKEFKFEDRVYDKDGDEVSGLYDAENGIMYISRSGIADAMITLSKLKDPIDYRIGFFLILAHESSHALDPIIKSYPKGYKPSITEHFHAEVYALVKSQGLLQMKYPEMVGQEDKYTQFYIMVRFKNFGQKVIDDTIKEYKMARDLDVFRKK